MKVTVLGISVLMMFSALLLSGDWIANDVRAVDVEPPQFEQPDHEKLTTGEEVYFYTNITDNEGIDTVKFHYSLDGGPNRELTLGGSNFTLDRWYISLVMPDTSLTFSFYFWANDTSGNHDESAHIGPVQVMDDNAPVFDDDGTTGIPTTGDPFTFRMNASDNRGLDEAYVVYSFGSGYAAGEMSETGGTHSKSIDVPPDATVLKYSFNFTDEAGNWENESRPDMDVLDNDVPSLNSHTPGTPETGESYHMSAIVVDNIDIGHLYVNYSFDAVDYSSKGMQYGGGDIWSASIDVPINATVLDYHFYGIDYSDNRLDTSDSGVHLEVEDIIAPDAKAGNDQTVGQGIPVAFDGSSCTDNIGIEDYEWCFAYDGKAKKLGGVTPSFTFMVAGTYTVTLNVTDEAGNGDTDTLMVIVEDTTLPTAKAGDDVTVDQGDTVTFDGTESQDDVGIVSFTWIFLYDDDEEILDGDDATFKFDLAGIYEVTLNVSDSEGNCHTDVLVVTVLDTALPEARAGPDEELEVGGTLVFNGSESRDNVGITDYIWTVEYGSKMTTLHGVEVNYTFQDPGEYVVTLTISDEAGNIGSDNLSVTVNEVKDVVAPVADASIAGTQVKTGGRYEIEVGGTVAFDANASTDDVGIKSYEWTILQGLKETKLKGSVVEHTFDKAGRYNITLLVTDEAGNSDKTGFSMIVSEKGGVATSVEEGTPAWVVILVILGIIGLVMMVFLIFLLVTKSKKSGVREKEEESAAAGPAPDTGPAVHTEAISTPEQEYIPPSAPGAEEAGYSDQYMVGQEVVDAELVREDPEQYMQLQGAPGQQEALPPAATPLCPNCGQHSEYYPEYECYWCEPCQSYVNAEEGETTVAGQAETGSVEQGAPVTQAVAANQGVPVTQAVTADQGVPVTQAVAPEQGGIPGGEQVSGALETPLTEGEVEDGEGEPGSTEQSLPSW